MKRKRKSDTVQRTVNPVQPAPAPAATRPMRVEHELDISHPDTAPKDADGWPIVAGCWVRAHVPSKITPSFPSIFTGPVLRVVRVENGRDHGRVLVYVRTEDGGRWGRVAPIECVRVRRKPASAKLDEARKLLS